MEAAKKTRKAKQTRKPRTIKTPTIKPEGEIKMSQPENTIDTPVAQPEVQTKPKSAARRERIPLGAPRQKLSAPQKEGKVRRWVNDDGGRLPMAEQGGYDFVNDPTAKIGDTNIGSGNQDLGTRISRIVGTKEDGSPMRAYLMEIDKDLYDSDQGEKAARIKEVDDQIRFGNIERKSDDGRYVPKDGISYKP